MLQDVKIPEATPEPDLEADDARRKVVRAQEI